MAVYKSDKSVKMNNGAEIPLVGLGTWQSTDQEAYDATIAALKSGYRHIDTAWIYGNEAQVGKAIKDSGVPREEIFITSKLWCTKQNDPLSAIKESLKLLQLDYLDLYLIHWPVCLNPEGNDPKFPSRPDGSRDVLVDWAPAKTWELMQPLVAKGLTKAIGVSNFTITNLDKLLKLPTTSITPAVNQVELHPYLPQPKLVKYCQDNDIVVEAYSPLGSTGSPLFTDPELVKLAEKNGVSTATIMISWAVWRNTVVLPKSVSAKRIEDNFKIIDLSDLDGELVNQISVKSGIKRFGLPNWGVPVFDSDE